MKSPLLFLCLYLFFCNVCISQRVKVVETNVVLNEDSVLILEPYYVMINEKLYLITKDRSSKLVQYEAKNGNLYREINLDKFLQDRSIFKELNEKIDNSYSISNYFITEFKQHLFLTLSIDYKKSLDSSVSMMSALSIYAFIDTNFNLVSTGFLGNNEFEKERDNFIQISPVGFIGDTVIFNKRIDSEDKINCSKSKIKLLQCYVIKNFKLIRNNDFFSINLTDLNKFPSNFSNLSTLYPFKSNSWSDSIYISDGYSLFKLTKNKINKIVNDIPMTISSKYFLTINDTLFVKKLDIDFKNNFKFKEEYIFKYYNNKLVSKISVNSFDKMYSFDLGKATMLYTNNDKKFYTLMQQKDDYVLKLITIQ